MTLGGKFYGNESPGKNLTKQRRGGAKKKGATKHFVSAWLPVLNIKKALEKGPGIGELIFRVKKEVSFYNPLLLIKPAKVNISPGWSGNERGIEGN